MGDEAEALNERYNGDEINDPSSIHYISNRKELYIIAGKAIIGETITCPVCEKRFKKKSYQKRFCSNKGRGNCKDRYHNSTNESRRRRAIRLNEEHDSELISWENWE